MSASSPEWGSVLRTMRRLFEHDPTDKASLKVWEREVKELTRRLRAIPEISNMDEIAWHFLIDADIRVKDEEYAQMQRAAFESWLKDAERALPPE